MKRLPFLGLQPPSPLCWSRWPDIRFHDLRHSAASLLLSIGTHPKVVQELLGHTQISMTTDIYSHVLPGMQQEAMNKLNEALENTKGERKKKEK
jgi:integrase